MVALRAVTASQRVFGRDTALVDAETDPANRAGPGLLLQVIDVASAAPPLAPIPSTAGLGVTASANLSACSSRDWTSRPDDTRTSADR